MREPLDDFVVASSNAGAASRVIGVLREHAQPERIWLHGPAGAGKSSLCMARASQRELLSARKPMFCAAAEVCLSVSLETEEEFLDSLATADVLFIDGFDDFLAPGAEEAGSLICKLLVQARDDAGKDTVIIAREPKAAYDLVSFEGALDAFEELRMLPLDAEGRLEFVRNRIGKYNPGGDTGPALDEDARAYLASEFGGGLADLDLALRYLMTAAGLDPAGTLGRADLARLLVV